MHNVKLELDPEGNIIVAAPLSGGRLVVAKFAPSGEAIWERLVCADEAPRDSVSPVLLDTDGYEASLRRDTDRGRWLGRSVVATVALMVGLAGFAVVDDGGPSRFAPAAGGMVPAAHTMGASVAELAHASTQAHAAASVRTTSPEAASHPEDAPEAPTPNPATAEAPPADDAPTATEEKSLHPSADEIPQDATSLRRQTLQLLSRGELTSAAEVARSLIAAAPEDATSYLFLGAALQDLGDGRGARRAYDACLRDGTRGPLGECLALGGRRP